MGSHRETCPPDYSRHGECDFIVHYLLAMSAYSAWWHRLTVSWGLSVRPIDSDNILNGWGISGIARRVTVLTVSTANFNGSVTADRLKVSKMVCPLFWQCGLDRKAVLPFTQVRFSPVWSSQHHQMDRLQSINAALHHQQSTGCEKSFFHHFRSVQGHNRGHSL